MTVIVKSKLFWLYQKTGYAETLKYFLLAKENKYIPINKQILNIDAQENLKIKSLIYIDKHLPAEILYSNPTQIIILSMTDTVIKVINLPYENSISILILQKQLCLREERLKLKYIEPVS
ncbi:hypothetical protein [Wolbachia endosymbiont of Trichogramma pretiosum]|uniref:hypothetical protein n=1 Tax=Wolbachia endosymbiont of Trichogramma pretiosum TaxID=125593 RepID=UPI000837E7EE|nr:hypothetical protein [Wolbachia endosymbiont of Trichogramma pretiosum]OCA06195.1 hypothetical protein wTpre_518 [Wolbachia endosymbiont of Trichogramma pretiosum]